MTRLRALLQGGSPGVATDPGASAFDWVLAPFVAALGAATIAATVTAQLSRFSFPVSALAGLVGGAAAVALMARHAGRLDASRWDIATALLMAVVWWRVLPAATPWPAYLDASWYVNTAVRIATEGSLVWSPFALRVDDAARRVLVTTFADQRAVGMPVPDDAGRGFHDVLFAVPDVGRPEAVPYHPPIFAAWTALFADVRGARAAGSAIVPWAAAYLMALAVLARRTFGPSAAPAAVALVGIGPAFVYYGSTPFAEVAAGSLLLAGLAALATLADGPPRPILAAGAGLSLGAAVLMKVDVALALGAALAWWLAARSRDGGPREAVGMTVGVGLPLLYGALLAASVSNLYVTLNGGGVVRLARDRPVWLVAALSAAAAAGLVLLFLLRSGRLKLPPVALRRAVAVGALVLLAVASVSAFLALETEPPSMVRLLAWVVSPLGLWAAAVGLAAALERGRGRTGPVIAVALLAVPILLAEPAVTRTLSPLYTARRLVPYAIPVTAVLGAALVPTALDNRDRRWQLGLLAGGSLALGSVFLESRPLLGARDFQGGPVLARRIAAVGGERDVFLFASTLDGSNSGRFAAMVANLEGPPTAVLASPDIDTAPLKSAVSAWLGEGRRVFAVADDDDSVPSVPGFEPWFVDETSIVPLVLAPSPLLPPRWVPYELHAVIYELLPEESG